MNSYETGSRNTTPVNAEVSDGKSVLLSFRLASIAFFRLRNSEGGNPSDCFDRGQTLKCFKCAQGELATDWVELGFHKFERESYFSIE